MAKHAKDLVERTFAFAQAVRRFVDRVPKSTANFEDARQVVRASGSVAANYLEAQEGLSRKDFFYRIKVCRKEARESWLWLRLINTAHVQEIEELRQSLMQEANELKLIFAAIASKDDSAE
jgi:four helix bundle protein